MSRPADPAVGRAGQREEQGRAEGLAVRSGVGLADRARVELPLGQVRGVLAAAGGAVPPCGLGRGGFPADARIGDLVVQLGDQLVKVGGVLSGFSAWSRCCCASARRVIHHFCSSVAGSGVMPGSSSRCQPSRHWAARSVLARSAQAGQTGPGCGRRARAPGPPARCRGWCGAAGWGGCRRRARRPGRGRLRGPAAWPSAAPGSSCP